MSVEQFALDVLVGGGGGLCSVSTQWRACRVRRQLKLIQKQFAVGSTAVEAAELQELQRLADQHLESMDSRMLGDVASMKKAAKRKLLMAQPIDFAKVVFQYPRAGSCPPSWAFGI